MKKEGSVRKLSTYVALTVVGIPVVAGSYTVAAHDDDRGSRRFAARLDGYQEVPANSTTGQGIFVAKLDEINGADVLEYTLTYRALEGTTTAAAHIHVGQRTANGGVSAFLCGGGDKPACPPTGGTVEGVIDAADVIGPAGQGVAAGEFAELIRAMRAGVTYANVHTNKHPGGEIRGQIGKHGDHDR